MIPINFSLKQKGNDWKVKISITFKHRFGSAKEIHEVVCILEEIVDWIKERKDFHSLIEKFPGLAEELKILNHATCGREIQCSRFNSLDLILFEKMSFSFVIKDCPAIILPGAKTVSFPVIQRSAAG